MLYIIILYIAKASNVELVQRVCRILLSCPVAYENQPIYLPTYNYCLTYEGAVLTDTIFPSVGM